MPNLMLKLFEIIEIGTPKRSYGCVVMLGICVLFSGCVNHTYFGVYPILPCTVSESAGTHTSPPQYYAHCEREVRVVRVRHC